VLKDVWVSIDPGIHTAIAYWKGSDLMELTTHKVETVEDAFILITNSFSKRRICACYVEGVEVYTGSAKSLASASRGNLSQLAYMVGSIMSACNTLGIICQVISPRKWKAQLTYKMLRNILSKNFNIEVLNNHQASAVGIGLHIQGKL